MNLDTRKAGRLLMVLNFVLTGGVVIAGAEFFASAPDPTGDARRRFNVRFYLVAVLFLIFDVEIIFLYPWAVLFPRLKAADGADQQWAADLAAAGFTPTFFAVGIGIFFLLLTIGFIYEWRKGVFRWD